jgi:thioesterase domain-containing protein
LARQLGPEQPFYGLESRGHDGLSEVLRSIEEIADDFVDQLLATTHNDFHLMGSCWGAAVAFEMALRLVSRGRSPVSLSLLDPAVLLRSDSSTAGSPRSRFIQERLELYWDEFRGGDWKSRGRMIARKARVAANLVRSREMPAAARLEMNQKRVRDANVEAVTKYQPRTLNGHARIFITEDRDLRGHQDPRLEWVGLIRPEPQVVKVAGFNSGDALTSNVASLANALRQWLEEQE